MVERRGQKCAKGNSKVGTAAESDKTILLKRVEVIVIPLVAQRQQHRPRSNLGLPTLQASHPHVDNAVAKSRSLPQLSSNDTARLSSVCLLGPMQWPVCSVRRINSTSLHSAAARTRKKMVSQSELALFC